MINENDNNRISYIKAAIERNIYNVYIENFPVGLEPRAVELARSNNYILREISPDFLRKDYIVALNSIKQDANAANYVDWDSMTKEQFDNLIQETINAGYLLSSESCYVLRDNPEVVLSSISKDINTASYLTDDVRNDPKVFKYLLLNGYSFTQNDLKYHSLNAFTEYDTMEYATRKISVFGDIGYKLYRKLDDVDIDEYFERYIKLMVKALNTPPTIQSIKNVLQVSAEQKWNNYRREHLDDYANVFGKICTELNNHNNYLDAIDNLKFLGKIKRTLGEKYVLLVEAMKQYHSIKHSDTPSDSIDSARDQIAKLSALYAAMSKENYKKEIIESCLEELHNFFIPRKTHPNIYKKIMERKQKRKFKRLYNNYDNETCDFINSIFKKYSDSIDYDILLSMIDNFVKQGYSKMNLFIAEPSGYYDYIRYQEACKLINRLNNHYIQYTDQELGKYRDIINYNSETDKYYYGGSHFDEEQINEYNEYRKKLIVFEKIKKEIILKTKKIEINEDIYDAELDDIGRNIPFTDEYFEYIGLNKSYFELNHMIDRCVDYIEPNSIMDDEAYEILTNYIINNGLFWILLFNTYYLNDLNLNKENVLKSFSYMDEVSRLSKIFNFDVNKYNDVLTLCELSQYADDKTIAILGKDIIFKLSKYRTYTEKKAEKIIEMAKELVCAMTKREKSTVPYVSGEINNYNYSIYSPQDETILLAGINTDACFRIDGNDNDFLHYCALDKNGFVIKITDTFGNFMGRASGFRNGNCVYINQLRTIYDEGGWGYEGKYQNEQMDIIKTFYKACDDIVHTSQTNKDEADKIDFVFVTQSYSLDDTASNVSDSIEYEIGEDPMDIESEDWEHFINNTKNLKEADMDCGFTTDYGGYSLICVSSSRDLTTTDDINPKDVEAVYTSPRSKIIETKSPDINIINKMNKINGIYSELNNRDLESIIIPKDSTILIGDNWYITHNNGIIIQSCVLDFDKKAVEEYETARLSIEQELEQSETESYGVYTKK